MLINIILCSLAAVVTGMLYVLIPTLSPWWIPALLIAVYAVGAVLELLSLLLYSCRVRTAPDAACRHRFYSFISLTADWVSLLCGTRVHFENSDKFPQNTPALLVCNHISNLDPLVTMAALRHCQLAFVSKPENFKIPVAATIVRNAGFLAIDRENPRNAVTSIKEAAANITQRQLCMCIYPEGTRNKSGEGLLPFHGGSFKIATIAKCPVAVFALRYEKGRFPFRKIAHLQIVDVLDTDYVVANRTDAIAERAKKLIQQHL